MYDDDDEDDDRLQDDGQTKKTANKHDLRQRRNLIDNDKDDIIEDDLL